MDRASPEKSRPVSARGKPGKSKAKSKKGGASKADAPSNAFRVAVRCRPQLPHERAKEQGVLTLSKGAVTIQGVADEADKPGGESPRASPRRDRNDAGLKTAKSFSFDHVYDEFCNQDEVYSQFVAPFTAQFLAGYNVTLFAYGQTGTGKTYTVIGGETREQRGVVPRFVEEVFAHNAAEAAKAAGEEGGLAPAAIELTEEQSAEAANVLSETRVEKVGVTILEVYDGKVYDLLAAEKMLFGSQKGEKGWTPHGTQLSLELEPAAPGQKAGADMARCYWVRGGERTVKSAAEALDALRDSLRLRHTASHALNAESSRSHCIFSLQVHRKRDVYKLERVERELWKYVLQPSRTSMRVTRANLVDLAGSEDARETLANGATLKEAGEINKSLFTLRKAIEHLALKKHTRSVFQEETLTKMLASSLLGQVRAYTHMSLSFSQISAPSHHPPILHTSPPLASPGLLAHDRDHLAHGLGAPAHAQHAALRGYGLDDHARRPKGRRGRRRASQRRACEEE